MWWNRREYKSLAAGLPLAAQIRIIAAASNRPGTGRCIDNKRVKPENNMASSVDELTVTYEEDGIETVRELDKEILTKGAWSTIIFRYRDWNRAKGEYGPDKYSIRRYQKRNGQYQQKSKFNISSREQAEKIIAALQKWMQD
jgi:hypothetical protein